MSADFTQKLPKSGNEEILIALKELDARVIKIDNRLEGLEKKVDGVEKKVDSVEKKVDSVDKRVDSVEKKVDERLHDTRPIWHRVVADIAQLQAGQQRLEEGQLAMRVELGNVSRDQIVINDSIRKMQLDFHTVNDRLCRLELNRNQPNSQT